MPLNEIPFGGEIRSQPLNENFQYLNQKSDDIQKKVPDNFGTIALQPHPLAKNPVLTKDDVTDLQAKFVADPFFAYEDGIYHMFFEAAEQTENGDLGHIAHATSVDGLEWEYNKIILTGGGHWAYPYVFKHNGDWYMLPDRGGSVAGLTLYRATNFPEEWEVDTQLFTDGVHIDATPVYWNGVWYLFDYEGSQSQETRIYYADDIKSTSWTLHPSSPVFTGLNLRPAGTPIISEDFIDLFIQDGTSGLYGEKTWIYRVTELTPTTFKYKKIQKPILEAQNNGLWNSRGMHHVSLLFTNKNSLSLAIVDGRANDYSWGIGVYTIGATPSKPALRAVLNTDQSVTSAQWTKVIFDQVIEDTKNAYSDGKYIVPETGKYIISISMTITAINAPNSQFLVNTRILKNGQEHRSSARLGHSTTTQIRQTFEFMDIFTLEAGDELEIEFYQSSGSTQSLLRQGWSTWFSLVKVD